MRTWVDRGGTFTDVVVLDDEGLRVRKVPSDAAVIGDLAEGDLCFGTTVATNALLERRGVRTALLVTRGFADLVHIGDMARPELFDPDARWPDPLCDAVFEVDGRLDANGEELDALGEIPDLSGFASVAIALLHSGANPSHELRVAEVLRARHPDLFVSLGHAQAPERGYLARIETTLVDAAITPVLHGALARDNLPEAATAIRSDGTLVPWRQLRAPDAVLSGPAGGVLAVSAIAALAGFRAAVGLDMGGTSTDVCRVEQGELPRREGEVRVAGVRVRRPILEVLTIAAGGGSILANDGLRLSVGPRSAGAHPGPQCYGRGGPPTLTDAALAVGLVDAEAFSPPLDASAVSLPGEAEAFLEVARDQMAAAVRTLATQRGADLRDHALVSYGGAAGQHAARVAEKLGIRTVLVHPCAAVLCAWGQSLARRGATAVRALWQPLTSMAPITEAWDALRDELPDLGVTLCTVELRHPGTDHALEVSGGNLTELRSAFARAHLQRYGFQRKSELEVVNVRVRTLAPEQAAPPPGGFGLTAPVHGPDVLRLPTTTIAIPAGWVADERNGLLLVERTDAVLATEVPTKRTPYGVALWSSRFMAIAEQAGAVLQRLARSVNIRERLDFSCAVFDGEGRLIANAPHIPVHLGAMGETVRDLLRHHPNPEPGQAWLCNDPAAGGSHLPDLTVVTAVHAGGERWFVANRGHHVDVGGSTPGSMPPHSQRLDEEGFVARHVPLLVDGALVELPILDASRDVYTVRADLEAQIAANHHAARALRDLAAPEVVSTWMAHLLDVASEAVQRRLASLEHGHAEDRVDGIPMKVRLHREGTTLVVDFEGTGGPHAGNLNAPRAVSRAAVLYALRVLVDEPIPLNEGALRHVAIRVPSVSLLDPPPHAAVAGGNVETSMRLVDLVLRAAGSRAASQGTMNNLTLGGDGWSLYETLGGGTGASARGPGASARQVHMTNTRATDPEILETRLPLRLRRFARRPHSGGDGLHPGGDGLIREVELTRPGTAALLATRRHTGAPGLDGGDPGLPGEDAVRRSGQWQAWSGAPIDLDAGDAVRVHTPGGGGFGAKLTS